MTLITTENQSSIFIKLLMRVDEVVGCLFYRQIVGYHRRWILLISFPMTHAASYMYVQDLYQINVYWVVQIRKPLYTNTNTTEAKLVVIVFFI